MIFYSWTALSDGDWTALSDGDRTALSDGDRTALSDGDRTALSDGDPGSPESSVAMGITDDRGRAMRAGEEALGSGQAVVVIIEAVRPAMAAHTLAPCYVKTGVGWLGRCTRAGEVAWNRFFTRGDTDEPRAPGRMRP
jgi:hypothetical protein